jgi:hypothetical protein
MVSHKKKSGMNLSVSINGGLRFSKRPSGYNACIGNALKGGAGPVHGGRYDKAWQGQFTSAAQSCAARAGSKMREAV